MLNQPKFSIPPLNTVQNLLHVSCSEFLPRILGSEYVKMFGLFLGQEGYSKSYNDRCSPDIYNSFATAAFRFGHSLIKPMFSLVPSERRKESDDIRLRNHFNNPDVVFRYNSVDHTFAKLQNDCIAAALISSTSWLLVSSPPLWRASTPASAKK